MKRRARSRIRWIARILRWNDRRQQAVPRITPYEASLFQANEEHKLHRETVRTR